MKNFAAPSSKIHSPMRRITALPEVGGGWVGAPLASRLQAWRGAPQSPQPPPTLVRMEDRRNMMRISIWPPAEARFCLEPFGPASGAIFID